MELRFAVSLSTVTTRCVRGKVYTSKLPKSLSDAALLTSAGVMLMDILRLFWKDDFFG